MINNILSLPPMPNPKDFCLNSPEDWEHVTVSQARRAAYKEALDAWREAIDAIAKSDRPAAA